MWHVHALAQQRVAVLDEHGLVGQEVARRGQRAAQAVGRAPLGVAHRQVPVARRRRPPARSPRPRRRSARIVASRMPAARSASRLWKRIGRFATGNRCREPDTTGQGRRRSCCRQGSGHRHLRPGQPPLLADRVQVRLGLRQRQPAAVLRRGLEDDGLRDRRGPRLAHPAARRLPDGRRRLIGKIHKAFNELQATGLVDQPVTTKMYGAQADRLQPDHATASRAAASGTSRSASRTRSARAWPSATRPTATSPPS